MWATLVYNTLIRHVRILKVNEWVYMFTQRERKHFVLDPVDNGCAWYAGTMFSLFLVYGGLDTLMIVINESLDPASRVGFCFYRLFISVSTLPYVGYFGNVGRYQTAIHIKQLFQTLRTSLKPLKLRHKICIDLWPIFILMDIPWLRFNSSANW